MGEARRISVAECPLATVKPLFETWHYSKSVFGVTVSVCFRVDLAGRLVGGAIFGKPAGMGVARKYAGDRPLLELRKFVMIDDTPRNSESRALGLMFRRLRKSGVEVVLSYADPAHGHVGTIYKATGFQYRGTTVPRKHFTWRGKTYPDRNLHQTKFPYHKELRRAVETGEARAVLIPGKHTYVLDLGKRR